MPSHDRWEGQGVMERDEHQELALTENRPILKCTLTPERKTELEQQLLECTLEIERLEELYRRIAVEGKELIKRNRLRQAEASHLLGQGFEMKPVRCLKEIDDRKGVYRLRRTDTKEVISERPLAEPVEQ